MDIITRLIEEYYEFHDEPKPKSFKTFLNEVNYGSMEKDIRITDITEKIKDDMLKNVDNRKLYNDVYIMVVPKSKNPVGVYYTIEWQFRLHKTENVEWFVNGAWFDKSKRHRNIVEIGINICKDTTKSDEWFVDELKKFIKSYKINEYLRHEVRHFLDLVDNKFQNDKTYKIDDATTATDLQKVKYLSQHKEIEAQLISVLSDFEHLYSIHNRTGNKYTIEMAMKDSKVYERFMRLLIPSKRSKYRTKIIHFWFTKFESRMRKGGF